MASNRSRCALSRSLADDGRGLGVGEVAGCLAGVLKWNFTQWRSFVRVDEAEGVAAEAVHVAVAVGHAAVAHHDGDLVQRLGQQGPEVPVVLRAAQVGARVALDRVVEVREAQRVAHEEHRRVVADHVPVAFLGVELDREAADVALGVGRAALAGDGGEAHEHLGLLADLGEELGLACSA